MGPFVASRWLPAGISAAWGRFVTAETVLVGALFALGLGALTVVLGDRALELDRCAAAPLPAPTADPLATYRDGGPLACPRHPSAP